MLGGVENGDLEVGVVKRTGEKGIMVKKFEAWAR